MSRSGYTDDFDERYPNARALYRRAVRNAIKGQRGQAFLLDLAAALDAMPEKRLAARTVVRNGEHCALGCIAAAKKVDLAPITYTDDDDEDADGDWSTEYLAAELGIPEALAREIVWENDECSIGTPEQRWERMRRVVGRWIGEAASKEDSDGAI